MPAQFNSSIADGLKQGILLGLAVLVLVLPPLRKQPGAPLDGPPPATGQTTTPRSAAAPAPQLPIHRQLDFRGAKPAAPVRQLAQWVVSSADNGHWPFVILDKRDARVWVFNREGGLDGV